MIWLKEENPELHATIQSLLAARRDGVLGGVHIIGVGWTESGKRTLYVGVDASRDPRPATWAPGRTATARITRRLIAAYGPLPARTTWEAWTSTGDWVEGDWADAGVGVIAAGSVVRGPSKVLARAVRALVTMHRQELLSEIPGLLSVSLGDADRRTQAALARFDVPSETLVGYVDGHRPLAGGGTLLWRENHHSGTAGYGIEVSGRRFLTTAGHLSERSSELLHLRVPQKRWGRRQPPCGYVIATTSPSSPHVGSCAPRGLDLAIVALEPDTHVGEWREISDVVPVQELHKNDRCAFNGGRTGHCDCYVNVIEADDDETAVHVQLYGRPRRGTGRRGDSGTAVFTTAGALIGHLVRVGGFRDGRAMQFAYVQPAELAVDYLEQQVGRSRPLFGDLGA